MFTPATLTSLQQMLDASVSRTDRRIGDRELQVHQEMSKRGILDSSLTLQRLARHYEAMVDKYAEEAVGHLISANEAEPSANPGDRADMLTDLLALRISRLRDSLIARFDQSSESIALSDHHLVGEMRDQLTEASENTNALWSGRLRMQVLARAIALDRSGGIVATINVADRSQVGNVQVGDHSTGASYQSTEDGSKSVDRS